MGLVVGVDGWKSGWLAVAVRAEKLLFQYDGSLAALVERFSGADAVVVDVPIGCPIEGRRVADREARRFVGPRGSSVFSTPPIGPLRMALYQEALELCREQYGYGLSKQSYALRDKIFEAEALALSGVSLFEGHPEVSFAALKGSDLEFNKRSWNGQMERRGMLASAGLVIPDTLPEPLSRAPVDDVLDAAVMAWTARRIHAGEARTLPHPPEDIGGRQVAIWY